MLEVGQKAPGFCLDSSDGTAVCLSDLAGRTAVLYFYPKDDTPGCTTEACAFRDVSDEFTKRGAVIYGVSPDSVASHERFRDKFQLPFPLLSDPGKAMLSAYGAWQEKSMYGRKYMGVARTTYIIGSDGTIVALFPNVKPADHTKELLGWLDEYQSNAERTI